MVIGIAGTLIRNLLVWDWIKQGQWVERKAVVRNISLCAVFPGRPICINRKGTSLSTVNKTPANVIIADVLKEVAMSV